MTEVNEKREAAKAKIKLYRENFPVYARDNLKVKDKAASTVPFILNTAQLYIHEKLEAQKAMTGKVRALVLKGRQQGASTYIGGRFYHRVSLFKGLGVYILTHEIPATENLFAMVDRYHKNNPLKPVTGKSNAKELSFPRLDGGYLVGTAGVKAGGRSRTIQLFHGSEVAFWPNDTDQFSGVVQAVPDLPGTEIILESTANGVTGEFYERWQQAEAGEGEYIAVFVPWFWDPGYSKPAPAGFLLKVVKEHEDETLSESEYASLHGLSNDQMYWRRLKINELGHVKFKQEYPGTADEAFQTTGQDSFIKPADVLRARKSDVTGAGPLVVGIDPSRYGSDRFSIAWRRGRQVFKVDRRQKVETTEAAFWIKRIIDEDKPTKAYMDAGGGGAQIYDVVVSFGDTPEGIPYADILELVNFSSPPEEPVIILDDGTERPGPKNRRSEMWLRSREWLKQVGGASIPDEGVLQSDACAPNYKYDISTQRLVLESKEQMRARKVRSPDDWDAIALTFASVVYEGAEAVASVSQPKKKSSRRRSGGSRSWMSR